MIDKLTEIVTSIVVAISGILVFMTKRIFNRLDHANKRIDLLEKTIVDQQFLENQLGPIRSDISLILKTLLTKEK